MATYINLMKLTDQGIKEIKGAPSRIEAAAKSLEALGGKLTAFYAVMGEYDYVAISEIPDDEVGMGFLLTLASAGNVRTTTLKAFDKDQFASIVDKIPIQL